MHPHVSTVQSRCVSYILYHLSICICFGIKGPYSRLVQLYRYNCVVTSIYVYTCNIKRSSSGGSRGGAPPHPSKQKTYFLQFCSLECILSIFIYNMALQIRMLECFRGHPSISDFHFLSKNFFPHAPPPPLPKTYTKLGQFFLQFCS